MTACYYCGDDDHAGKQCPKLQAHQQRATITPAPRVPRGDPVTWCSYCDEATRLLDMGHSVSRCPQCHPLRHQQLRQSRKCPSCHATVYEWDHGPCGAHAGPGRDLPRPATTGRPDWTRADPRPLCYRSPLGMMVHQPGCACPPGVP